MLLYFHGGAWVMGDKREQGIPMLEYLAERGYVCVTANYALSPKAKWPRHVVDCKLALLWVKRHITEYGGDPGLVFVSGCSAGGHLAALACAHSQRAGLAARLRGRGHHRCWVHPALRRLRLRRSGQDRQRQSVAHPGALRVRARPAPRSSRPLRRY